jgi:hypothetical protein
MSHYLKIFSFIIFYDVHDVMPFKDTIKKIKS